MGSGYRSEKGLDRNPGVNACDEECGVEENGVCDVVEGGLGVSPARGGT